LLFANFSEVAITNAYARNQQADPIILVSKRKLSGNQKLNGKPKVKLVTVGKGTSKPLQNEGFQILFEPSDATGESLAAELPNDLGNTILYPSSALADNKLVTGLENRGFKVINFIA
jgi:uroporphyrinogen-III synthase